MAMTATPADILIVTGWVELQFAAQVRLIEEIASAPELTQPKLAGTGRCPEWNALAAGVLPGVVERFVD